MAMTPSGIPVRAATHATKQRWNCRENVLRISRGPEIKVVAGNLGALAIRQKKLGLYSAAQFAETDNVWCKFTSRNWFGARRAGYRETNASGFRNPRLAILRSRVDLDFRQRVPDVCGSLRHLGLSWSD